MSNALRTLLHRNSAVMPVLGRLGHCAVCRAGFLRYEQGSHWYHYVLWRCDHCGVRQRYPQPPRIETREQYNAQAPLRSTTRDWNFISAHVPATGRLLHVECDEGQLLSAAQAAGWEAYGTTRSETMARRASEVTGLPVEAGTLETCGFEDGIFDVLVLWNVVELSKDPEAFLAAAVRKLKPDGRLFLQTPNADSVFRRFGRSLWPQLLPIHRFLFNPVSLRQLAQAAGLRIVDIMTPGTALLSRAFFQKTGWLQWMNRQPWASRVMDKIEPKLHLSDVAPDRLGAAKSSLFGHWLEYGKRGDQLLVIAERAPVSRVPCPNCQSVLVQDGDAASSRCLGCGVRRIALPASVPQPVEGARVKFQRAQQSVWLEVLLAAERDQLHGRLIDIGCADGGFMHVARERHWDAWGVEPGDFRGSIASPLMALRTIEDPTWEERFMPESCQMATLWDTLHQSESPRDLLQAAFKLLAPDGRLLIRMMNPASVHSSRMPVFQRRYFNARSACWLYRPEQLRDFCQAAGFIDIQVDAGIRWAETEEGAVYLPASWPRPGALTRIWRRLRGTVSAQSPWIFVTAKRPALSIQRRVRVLHLAQTIDRSEQSHAILASVRALPFNRYQSDLIAGDVVSSGEVLEFRKAGARVRTITILKEMNRFLSLRNVLRALRETLRDGNYDVVHTYGFWAGMVGRWAAFGVRKKSKGAIAKWVVHQPMGHRFRGFYGWIASSLVARLERHFARQTDALIVPGDPTAYEYMGQRAAQFDRIAIVPPGTQSDVPTRPSSEVRGEMNLPDGGWFMGYRGELGYGLGIEVMLEMTQSVFASDAEARLLISGKGEGQLDFEALAKQLSISDRVYFLEDHAELSTFLSAIDVVIVPSPKDGTPHILVEAAGARRPVIATDLAGHAGVVVDGVTGILVPPNDSGAMAKAVLKMAQGRKDAQRMGESAHAWAQRLEDGAPQFSVERMVELVRALYGELPSRNSLLP